MPPRLAIVIIVSTANKKDPEGRRPLERPKRKWKEDIKMDLRLVGYRGMDWIGLTEDRNRWLACFNAVMNLRIPLNSGNF